MQYRSVADLNDTILAQLHRLPPDIDLVVGIPRSGLLAANIVSLALNVPLADIDGFLAGRLLATGKTRHREAFDTPIDRFRRVLVIDDSLRSGASLVEARAKIARSDGRDRYIFCAVYGVEQRHAEADIILEAVPVPRMFQWNFMHHKFLEHCCVDIDGVLCFDPMPEQNDDGPHYEHFLGEARQLLIPTKKIGHLVTSRLERYREHTEGWLAARGIEYGKLWMLDLPSAEERRRQGAHGAFKAQVYKSIPDAMLFIESEERQAHEIAELAGRPVLSIASHSIVYPGAGVARFTAFMARQARVQRRSVIEFSRRRRFLQLARRTLGDDLYLKVKNMFS